MLIIITIGTKIPNSNNSDQHSKYEQTILPTPIQPAGSIRIIVEPDDHMQTIYQAVSKATHSIDIVIYELDDKKLEMLLATAAQHGITVRVILNKIQAFGGKISPTQQSAFDFLNSHGVQAKFSSSRFTYTHQKTIVIDNTVALIMTMNLATKYYATSRDFGVIISSPHDLPAIETTFESDWSDKPIDSQNGDDLLWSPGAETAMINVINKSQKTLDIYNEEMYDDTITNALIKAAKRGVHVRVTMTYSTGEKPAFNNLVSNGVSLRTYSGSSKTMYVHAKMILADDNYAIVGSQNFSWTSLEKNRELGIFITDPKSISILEKTFNADFDGARIYKPKK